MARYYEESALIEYVKRHTPHINGETTIDCAERAIREAPTADVVPRAELAIVSVQNAALIEANQNLRKQNTEYKIEIEVMRMAANSYKMHFEDVKTEIASKIILEIDTLICCHANGDIDDKTLYTLFDELKKKYIGGE